MVDFTNHSLSLLNNQLLRSFILQSPGHLTNRVVDETDDVIESYDFNNFSSKNKNKFKPRLVAIETNTTKVRSNKGSNVSKKRFETWNRSYRASNNNSKNKDAYTSLYKNSASREMASTFYNPRNQTKDTSFDNEGYLNNSDRHSYDLGNKMHLNDMSMDSCISLRPLGTDRSTTEILSVASTSNFKAPELFKFSVNIDDKVESKIEKKNRQGLKSASIHQGIINKRKASIRQNHESNEIETFNLATDKSSVSINLLICRMDTSYLKILIVIISWAKILKTLA